MTRKRRAIVRFVRLAVAIVLVVGLLAPSHFVGTLVAYAEESSAVDQTSCPDDDDGCPPNCSICPCGERPCVPSAAVAEVAEVETTAQAPTIDRIDVLHGRIETFRLDRPPRILA